MLACIANGCHYFEKDIMDHDDGDNDKKTYFLLLKFISNLGNEKSYNVRIAPC